VATIKVISAGAVKAIIVTLAPEFERESGHKLDLDFGTAGAQRDRIKGGEPADLVVLSETIIAGLRDVVTGVRNLGATVTGVVVKEGAPLPDISTPEAFKQALLKARNVAYTDPKAGGSGGIMFVGLMDKLGLADAINKNAVLCKGGYDVAAALADGRADLGTTFISEALPVKGVKVVGTLPGNLHYTNTYTAAIHAKAASPDGARAFLDFLTNPAKRDRWTAAGLEPAF
jgi:molybdate transport system substrate-binding protein